MPGHDGGATGFWDAHYERHVHVWSGAPNAVLVAEVGDLAPGTALDLGCGEGADAVWLGRRGWHVTAVDISVVALARASRQAEAASVTDRVTWERSDLDETFPVGSFDLVTAHYLHSPLPARQAVALRHAAAAVAPAGHLLVVGHASVAPWSWDPHAELPSAGEVLESLALDQRRWSIDVCEDRPRPATGPDGEVATVTDSVLHLVRTS